MIQSLRIDNLRGIAKGELTDLSPLTVLAYMVKWRPKMELNTFYKLPWDDPMVAPNMLSTLTRGGAVGSMDRLWTPPASAEGSIFS